MLSGWHSSYRLACTLVRMTLTQLADSALPAQHVVPTSPMCRSMLAERLLGKCDYDCDRELRTLELLKASGGVECDGGVFR